MFLLNADIQRSVVIQHYFHFWLASPTTFAALRLNGVGISLAEFGQAWVAIAAVSIACLVWRRTTDVRLRCSVLVISTLIANPYVWHYELTWLGVALACLASLGFEEGWLWAEQEVLALAWLLPLYEYFNPHLNLPQVGPIVLLCALLIVPRRLRATAAGVFLRKEDGIAARGAARDCPYGGNAAVQSVNSGG